jgi:type IV pilus assembly protein PilN
MYGLDINFLKDRPEYNPTPVPARRGGRSRSMAPESRRPLWLGLIAGLGLAGLAGASWLFLQFQNDGLRNRQAELDAQLGRLKAEQAKLQGIVSETRRLQDQTTALGGIFGSIKPWSALFNDITARSPAKVRIFEIKDVLQSELAQLPESFRPSPSPSPAAAPAPSPAASPAASPGASPAASPAAARPAAPTASPVALQSGLVQISGEATSFNDVNDFLLNLQQSKFFKPEMTKILSSQLGEPKRLLEPGDLRGGGNQAVLPPGVEFKIIATLTDRSSAELLPELERNRAAGLVTRIQTLQQKGGIKP